MQPQPARYARSDVFIALTTVNIIVATVAIAGVVLSDRLYQLIHHSTPFALVFPLPCHFRPLTTTFSDAFVCLEVSLGWLMALGVESEGLGMCAELD